MGWIYLLVIYNYAAIHENGGNGLNGGKNVFEMENVRNSSNNLSVLTELEQKEDLCTRALGDENVFQCCELLTALVRSKKWSAVGRTLTTISELLLKPENR